jgi:iron complex transport system substrate-binding protein
MFLSVSLALASLVQSPPSATTIRVTVGVDFGTAGRPALHRAVELASNSNAVDAARALAEVEQDWLCCSKDDVWSIGGVGPDPRRDRYWMWKLGGEMGPNLPARYRLGDGDVVDWIYVGGTEPVKLEARVVSLLPAATEIALAVGGESALVGLSHLCAQPPGRELPRVLSTPVDSERWSMAEIDRFVHDASARTQALYVLDEARIRELAPTLVLSQGLCPVCAATPEMIEPALAKDGEKCARLLVLSPRSLAEVAQNIRDVGKALGRESPGKIAARDFERRFEAVRAQPRPSPRPRVVVLEWFEPLWVSGEWIAEMVEAAGGEPLLAGAHDPSRRIAWTDLAAADPDVIVLAACSMSVARTERELGALLSRAEWSSLRAVRDAKVFVMNGDQHFSTPGPGLAEGAELLQAILRDPRGVQSPPTAEWKRVGTPR